MIFRLTLIVLVLLFGLTACTPDEIDSSSVVQERFERRVSRLTASLLEDCRKDILAEALLRADSLLDLRAERMRRIAGRPPRPVRPGAPPVRELSAPLPLRPLFPFEIRFDSLLRDSLFLDSLRVDSIDRGLLEMEILPEVPR